MRSRKPRGHRLTSRDLYDALIETDLYIRSFSRADLRKYTWEIEDAKDDGRFYPRDQAFINWALANEFLVSHAHDTYRFTDTQIRKIIMTKKSASADLYEVLKMDEVYTNGFDRPALRQAIWRVEGNDAHYPSEDSFIDWAMKHEKIKRVSPGNYEFMDHLREGTVLTDNDPEHPMMLEDEEEELDLDAFSELMSGLMDHLVEMQELDDKVRAFKEAAEMRPENMYLIVDDVKRLPRKQKKQMKRDLIRGTVARKVTFGYLPQVS